MNGRIHCVNSNDANCADGHQQTFGDDAHAQHIDGHQERFEDDAHAQQTDGRQHTITGSDDGHRHVIKESITHTAFTCAITPYPNCQRYLQNAELYCNDIRLASITGISNEQHAMCISNYVYAQIYCRESSDNYCIQKLIFGRIECANSRNSKCDSWNLNRATTRRTDVIADSNIVHQMRADSNTVLDRNIDTQTNVDSLLLNSEDTSNAHTHTQSAHQTTDAAWHHTSGSEPQGHVHSTSTTSEVHTANGFNAEPMTTHSETTTRIGSTKDNNNEPMYIQLHEKTISFDVEAKNCLLVPEAINCPAFIDKYIPKWVTDEKTFETFKSGLGADGAPQKDIIVSEGWYIPKEYTPTTLLSGNIFTLQLDRDLTSLQHIELGHIATEKPRTYTSTDKEMAGRSHRQIITKEINIKP